MLVSTLLCVVLANAHLQEGAAGQVVATLGGVKVERSTGSVPAQFHTVIAAGDRLTTGPRGGASFFLGDDVIVHLGPQTSVQIAAVAPRIELALARGELRVTSGGSRPLVVRTSSSQAEMQQGILRVGIRAGNTRYWSEDGEAVVSSQQKESSRRRQFSGQRVSYVQDGGVTIHAGQEVTVSGDGEILDVIEALKEGWTIDVNALLMESATAASRQQIRGAADGMQTFDLSQTPPPTPRPTSYRTTPDSQTTQDNFAAGVGFLGSPGAGSTSATASGGNNADNGNVSAVGDVPGWIYAVTNYSRYSLSDVQLQPSDGVGPRTYFSIGVGDAPTEAVKVRGNQAGGTDPDTGDFRGMLYTNSGEVPTTLSIPHFEDFYVIQWDVSTYDPAVNNVRFNDTLAGPSGNVNAELVSSGAPVPLLSDSRDPDQINASFTSAVGEFVVRNDAGTPTIDLRRTDQDRQIVLDEFFNPVNSVPNNDIDVADFVEDTDNPNPGAPPVFVKPAPNSFKDAPTFSKQDKLRQAAVTTILADQLKGYSRRTGQTRFVIDNKVIDIRGYKPK